MNGTRLTTMLRSTLSIFIVVGLFHFLLPEATFSQGRTTSAIVGQVSDASGAAVPSATGTVTNKETGLRRSSSTDDSGRFNFPQLKPGAYSVKVEAEGFEPKQNDVVSAGRANRRARCTGHLPPHIAVLGCGHSLVSSNGLALAGSKWESSLKCVRFLCSYTHVLYYSKITFKEQLSRTPCSSDTPDYRA